MRSLRCKPCSREFSVGQGWFHQTVPLKYFLRQAHTSPRSSVERFKVQENQQRERGEWARAVRECYFEDTSPKLPHSCRVWLEREEEARPRVLCREQESTLHRITAFVFIFMWAQACPDASPPLYPRDFPEPFQGWKRTLPDKNGGELPSPPRDREPPRPPLLI